MLLRGVLVTPALPDVLPHALVRILLTTGGACTGRCEFLESCSYGRTCRSVPRFGQPLHHTYVAAFIRLAALPPVLYSRLISKRQDCHFA
jgi:hypothetical protein